MSLAGLTLGSPWWWPSSCSATAPAPTSSPPAASSPGKTANHRLAPRGGLDERLYVYLVRSQPGLDAMPELHAWLRTRRAQLPAPGYGSFNPGPFAPTLWRAADTRTSIFPAAAPTASGSRPRGQTSRLAAGPVADLCAGRRVEAPPHLTLAGTFEPGAIPMERLLVTDIGLAQPLLWQGRKADRIVFQAERRAGHCLQVPYRPRRDPSSPSAALARTHQPGPRCQPARRCPWR